MWNYILINGYRRLLSHRNYSRQTHLFSTTSQTVQSVFSNNPLLGCIKDRQLPPFKEIELIHIEPAIKHTLDSFLVELKKIEDSIQHAKDDLEFDQVIKMLELHSDPLERTWGLVGHLMSVKNSEKLRKIHDKLQSDVIQALTQCAQSKVLFDYFQTLRQSNKWDSLNEPQQRIVDLSLRSARSSGVDLESGDKDRFNDIQLRLASLKTQFSNNVLDSTRDFSLLITDKDRLEGLSDSVVEMLAHNAQTDGYKDATKDSGPWKITLEMPCYLPVMQNASDRSLRKEVYTAFISRASQIPFDNTEVMHEILCLRQEKAKLLGFQNYAEVSLSSKMASNVASVMSLIEQLKEKSYPKAKEEFKQLNEFASSATADSIELWDLPYWIEKQRQALFGFSEEEIKAYFPLSQVLHGLFDLVHRLFHISIHVNPYVQSWNKDVKYYNVYNEKEEIIAGFYLDLFARGHEKNGGAWMNGCVGRSRYLSSSSPSRIPVAYLICNQSPPVGETPSLMTFREVETLFHEFGHGLQHMLTSVDYGAIAGISGVEWDAVELPSQLMENFCYHKETLLSISSHYQTGDPLPLDLFDKLVASRKYMAASYMLRQLNFSELDMYLHHQYEPNEQPASSILKVQQEIAKKYSILPPSDKDRFLCSFNHIFAGGYSAGYYSYKWAEVLSCDAFSAFTESKNEKEFQEIGLRFRDSVLSLGGSRHPLAVFQDFRGREQKIDPLLELYGLQ